MWTWLKNGMFWLVSFFNQLCGDWGLAIIVITILFRILITPLTIKQTKSTYAMQKVQPQMQALQVKYADDQPRMQEEMRKLYSENNVNPVSGCLPMFLQMPIFIILFQVLRDYLPTESSFFSLIPQLTLTPKGAWAQGIGYAIPYIVLMALFAVSSLIPMLTQQSGQRDQKTMIMSCVMMVFMVWISWGSPAGVLIFWDISSIIGVIQQTSLRAKYKREDEEIEAQKPTIEPVQTDVVRRVKKSRPKKKGK